MRSGSDEQSHENVRIFFVGHFGRSHGSTCLRKENRAALSVDELKLSLRGGAPAPPCTSRAGSVSDWTAASTISRPQQQRLSLSSDRTPLGKSPVLAERPSTRKCPLHCFFFPWAPFVICYHRFFGPPLCGRFYYPTTSPPPIAAPSLIHVGCATIVTLQKLQRYV